MTARRDRRGTGTQELAIKRNDVRFLERRFRGERRLPEKFNAPRALEKRGVLRHRNSIRLAASKFNGPRRCNFALERCHGASGAGRVRCRKGTARTLRALLCPKGQQKYPEKERKEKKKERRTFPCTYNEHHERFHANSFREDVTSTYHEVILVQVQLIILKVQIKNSLQK